MERMINNIRKRRMQRKKKREEREIRVPSRLADRTNVDYAKENYKTLKEIESHLVFLRLTQLNILGVLRFFQYTYLAIITGVLIYLITLFF